MKGKLKNKEHIRVKRGDINEVEKLYKERRKKEQRK